MTKEEEEETAKIAKMVREHESNTDMYLTDTQWLAAMNRMVNRITEQADRVGYDRTDIGDKNTEFSWGMCYQGPEFWPKEDRMFPDQEPIRGYGGGSLSNLGTVSPKYSKSNHVCPLDRGGDPLNPSRGCFYRCKHFKAEKNAGPLKRIKVLKMYDQSIQKFKDSS